MRAYNKITLIIDNSTKSNARKRSNETHVNKEYKPILQQSFQIKQPLHRRPDGPRSPAKGNVTILVS